MWIDSHCHINDKAFDEDRDEVLDRMVKADVRKAMIVSLNKPELEKARTIRKQGIDFLLSVGVFPEDSYVFSEEEKKAVYDEFAKPDIAAVGEIGLDYYWDKEHKEIQQEVFKTQLAMAKDLKKPVIIHSRDAAEDTYKILKESGVTGVMHCYSGSHEMALEYVKLGFYISLAGVVTFKNAREPLEVARAVPLDRLLIETDCPYLTPVPYRGKRN
ncbi:MAG: TatD family hydrolase, partial [Erysipelotrichaceae bacterium]|nr:TatD family hydrolase [Erysipelotrichaceae bacterium]